MSLTPRIDKLDKNYIINGAMDFWQRGTSYSGSVTNLYIADRFLNLNVDSVNRSTDVPTSAVAQYSLETGSASGFVGTSQRIESAIARGLIGKTVTLAFWAKSVSGATDLRYEINSADVKDNFGAITQVYNTPISGLTTSWARFNVSFEVTPTMAQNGFDVRLFTVSASTTRWTEVMLTEGDRVQDFTLAGRNYAEELQLCQRYYQQLKMFSGIPVSASRIRWTGRYITEMRASPSLDIPIGTFSAINHTGGFNQFGTGFAASAFAGSNGVHFETDGYSGISTSWPGFVHNAGADNSYLELDAEL